MKPLLLVQILAVIRVGSCIPCSTLESLNITEGWLHPNNSIFQYGIEFKSGSWYEVKENDQTTRYGCPCIEKLCMFKCCPAGQLFYNSTCWESDSMEPFSPPLFKEQEPSALKVDDTFYYLYGRACAQGYLADTGVEELYIQEVSQHGALPLHPPKSYCAEMRTTDLSSPPRLSAIICYPEEVSTDDSYVLYTAYAVGLMLSVPFLLATFLVYALIPELRNLHGMCLMAYCGGLIVAYPFLAYLKLHIGTIGVEMPFCLTVAFIVYYAFQTSFFWLNVMCFDIWRTFSGYRGGGTSKRRENRRFTIYAVYAWGVPLALTAVTAAMQFSD
ncbi:Methuselah-like protein 10, partial [Operophtera brumata]